MKICDLVQWYGGEGGGGIRTYVDRKAEGLAARPGTTHVLVRPGARDRRREAPGRVIYEVSGRRMAKGSPYRWFGRLDAVARILRDEAPDLIEFDSPYHLPWLAFRQRARSGCAVVGFYHADVPAAYVETPLRRHGLGPLARPARAAAEAYVRSVASRCDATLAAAPVMLRRLDAMAVPRTALVPLGVDLACFRPRDDGRRVRRRLGCPAGAALLLYVGRFVAEKRVDVLADMVERLPDVLQPRLVLVGDGPLAGDLRDRAAAVNRLLVLPFEEDRDRLASLLAAADAYVTAGPHETFGLSVVEAMACGTPVVGVAAGALPDRVPPGTGLLAPPGDAAAFAAAVTDLLAGDPDAAGRRARDHVRRTAGWDAFFAALDRAYAAALAHRHRPYPSRHAQPWAAAAAVPVDERMRA